MVAKPTAIKLHVHSSDALLQDTLYFSGDAANKKFTIYNICMFHSKCAENPTVRHQHVLQLLKQGQQCFCSCRRSQAIWSRNVIHSWGA